MLRSLTPMRWAMVFALAESYLTPPSCGIPFLYAPIAMIRACVSAKAVAEHTENATAQAVRNAAFMKSSQIPASLRRSDASELIVSAARTPGQLQIRKRL